MRNYLRYPLNIQLFAEDGSGGEGGDTGGASRSASDSHTTD